MRVDYISSSSMTYSAMLTVMDENDNTHDFGKRLRRLREDLGLTQPDVVAYLTRNGIDIGQTAISHYETGRRYPSPPTLVLLARLYGTSVDYMLGLTENPLSVAEIEEELAENKGQGETDQVLRQLSPGKKAQVLEYAKYLLSLEQSRDAERNQRLWAALLAVMDRRLGSSATADVLATLHREFPDLAALVESAAESEQKRLQEG